MGTRCGDIDPSIPMFLQKNEKIDYKEVDRILNKMSGLQGISEVSSDMRDIEKRAEDGDHQAHLAIEIFVYRIKKYIGSYIAAMNGVDLIIFTAGIGENDCLVRRMVLEDMEFFGISFDPIKNKRAIGRYGIISTPESKITVMVIPTNEELEIAKQTLTVILNEEK